MQFRAAGNKIQLIEYAGYSKEKKRSVVRMLGSIDRYSPRLTDDLKKKLTAEQVEEVQAYIKQEAQRSQIATASVRLHVADSTLAGLADYITLIHSDTDDKVEADRRAKERAELASRAERIWAGIDQLQKALRKAGQGRPKKAPKQVQADPRQRTLV